MADGACRRRRGGEEEERRRRGGGRRGGSRASGAGGLPPLRADRLPSEAAFDRMPDHMPPSLDLMR
jgi:hypothetical protein